MMGRSLRIAAAVFAGTLAATLAFPLAAQAATWTEGTAAKPFSIADLGGLIVTTDTPDPSLVVPPAVSTTYDGNAIEFEPRSIRVLSDGSILVACGKHGTIVLISKTGRLLRQYSSADIPGLQRPFDASPTSDGGMLIVDRAEVQGEGRVFRVDSNLNVVWQFGGTSGMGAGQVFDPFTAEQLHGGHTLIADSLGYRVIEIDDATGEIAWSYGEFKVPGAGEGHLNRPHSAQRLANGDTLICDSENQRVIEVDPSKRIVWSYGTGVAGSGDGQLANPNSAVRIASGATLICDSDNGRVLEIDASGHLARTFGTGSVTPTGGSLSDPRAATRLTDGTTLVADLGNMRLATFGFPQHREYVATSSVIDPLPSARKRFVSLRVNATVPAGSLLAVEYSINSGAWTDLLGSSLPSNAIGTSIRYRLHVTTGDGSAAPVVRDVSLDWVVSTSGGSGDGDNTDGTHDTTGTAGQGDGSGTTTTTVPGGSTTIPQGDSTGGDGTGGTVSSTVSGWVMSEVKNDVATFGAAGSSGSGYGGSPMDSTLPGTAVLIAVYVLGFVWTPTARLTSSVVGRIVSATLSR
jgi:hypothetical protein